MATDLTALWSTDDPQVDADGVDRWRNLTNGRYRGRAFSGGHFYLVSAVADVVAMIRGTTIDAGDSQWP